MWIMWITQERSELFMDFKQKLEKLVKLAEKISKLNMGNFVLSGTETIRIR